MSKYVDLTLGQIEALIDILGKENVGGLLAGNVSVEFKEVAKKLFDKHGRRIPEGLRANICAVDSAFNLVQPKLDTEAEFANRITRLKDCLKAKIEITAGQFKKESERLIALIKGNPQIANIANSIWLPVILPKFLTNNIGEELENYCVAVNKSYTKIFSDRKFYNNREGTLKNNVDIIHESRHDQLIEKMNQGTVIGIYFPNSLQGYSICASREQMATLPEGFVLSGMDIPIAVMMYPDILARDWNTLGLDLAAFSWRSAVYSLNFRACDDRLDFYDTDYLAHARGNYSGGLLFLG